MGGVKSFDQGQRGLFKGKRYWGGVSKISLSERQGDGFGRAEAPLNNALTPREATDHFQKVLIRLFRKLLQRES